MPLVKFDGESKARRMSLEELKPIIAMCVSSTVVRHTVHRNSTETIVTDYHTLSGTRIRVTESFSI